MIAKIRRYPEFRGILEVIFSGCGTRVVGGNLSSVSVQDLVNEFSAIKGLRPDAANPVFYTCLSLRDGEKISLGCWRSVVSDYLEMMKFDMSVTAFGIFQGVAQKRDYVHILVSRVGLDGSLWLGRFEVIRAIEITRELERRYSLVKTEQSGGIECH